MPYVGTPRFEALKRAHQEESARLRREMQARLDLMSAEAVPPAQITTPADLAVRLLSDRLPRG